MKTETTRGATASEVVPARLIQPMTDWRQSVLEPDGRTARLPIPYDKNNHHRTNHEQYFEIGVPAVCLAERLHTVRILRIASHTASEFRSSKCSTTTSGCTARIP